jgi:hypothetical protein
MGANSMDKAVSITGGLENSATRGTDFVIFGKPYALRSVPKEQLPATDPATWPGRDERPRAVSY